MKNRKNISTVWKISGCLGVLEVVIMLILFFLMNSSIVNSIKDNTMNNMLTVTQDRTKIINDYIVEAEQYITAYSRAGEIKNIMLNPTDNQSYMAAQAYTEKFSADKEFLEGIYASEFNTHVLTHTNSKVVGITTRKDEALKELQDTLISTDGVYNAGIIISPASEQQIISMYMACYDDSGNPIGLTGCGIFTEGLINVLDNLKVEGMDKMDYYLINAENGKYIFNKDAEKIGEEVQEEYVKNIIDEVKKGNYKSTLEVSNNGENYLASYNYMEGRDWILVLTDPSSEIFANITKTRFIISGICGLALIIFVIITVLLVQYMMRPLKIVEKAIIKLQKGELSEVENLENVLELNDEIGSIALATKGLYESLTMIVSTLDECSDDLDEKSIILGKASNKLVQSVSTNTAITQELSASIEQTDNSVENVDDQAKHIAKNVKNIEEKLELCNNSSDELKKGSTRMKEKAHVSYQTSKDKYNKATESAKEALSSLDNLSKITVMTNDIMAIANQTNLLSLNASIEAARAGEHGKGFSVVATEISHLADTSKTTATSIQEICNQTDANIGEIRKFFEDLLDFLDSIVIKDFEMFAEEAKNYNDKVVNIENQITQINALIKILSTAVENIVSDASNVTKISKDNMSAVTNIIEQSEKTSGVAENVNTQSEEIKELLLSLRDVVNKFSKTE